MSSYFLRDLFTASGRIEGPGSTTLAYKLNGPLGPKGPPIETPVVRIDEVVGSLQVDSEVPSSGVPYALRRR